jgi:hypothetical protein
MKPEYVLATLVAVVVIGIAIVTSLDQHFTATPPRCEGQSFDLVTAPGGRSPYIRLAADRRTGPFLLDYGATTSSLSRDVFQADPAGGGKVVINKFSLPSCCLSGKRKPSDTTSVRAAEPVSTSPEHARYNSSAILIRSRGG